MTERGELVGIRGFNASASLKPSKMRGFAHPHIRVSEALMPRPH